MTIYKRIFCICDFMYIILHISFRERDKMFHYRQCQCLRRVLRKQNFHLHSTSVQTARKRYVHVFFTCMNIVYVIIDNTEYSKLRPPDFASFSTCWFSTLTTMFGHLEGVGSHKNTSMCIFQLINCMCVWPFVFHAIPT